VGLYEHIVIFFYIKLFIFNVLDIFNTIR